jgi:hypothetical protein
LTERTPDFYYDRLPKGGAVSAPRVLDYAVHPTCPGCGLDDRFGLRPWWMWFTRGARFTTLNVGFCPGGKPPTDTVPVAAIQGSPQMDVAFLCAGIDTPHVHLTCRGCNCHWIMQCWDPALAEEVRGKL